MKKIYLDIPYEERQVAKSQNCRWDSTRRKWYFRGEDEAVLPEALRAYRIAEVVDLPDFAAMRNDMLALAEIRLPEVIADLAGQDPLQLPVEWAGGEDKVAIYRHYLATLRQSAAQELEDAIREAWLSEDQPAKQQFENMLRSLAMRLWEASLEARWQQVSKPFYDSYFGFLEGFDLDALPHGRLEPGHICRQGDVVLEICHINCRPAVYALTYKGEVRFHHDNHYIVRYNGRSTGLAWNQPQFCAFSRKLRERHLAAASAIFAAITVDERSEWCLQGSDYTVTTTDGRVIGGFRDTDEYYILTLDGENLPDCPEKDRLCDRIKSLFHA